MALVVFEYGFAFVLGILIGSFLNVVALRLPKRMMWQWKHDAEEFLRETNNTASNNTINDLDDKPSSETKSLEDNPAHENPPADLVKKRSHCYSCKSTIAWYDNIPLVSYLLLRGKCRHCKTSISMQYPLVEFASGVLAVLAVWKTGMTIDAVALYGFLAVLLVLTVIDFQTQLLPDDIVLPSLWIALVWSVVAGSIGGTAIAPEMAIVGASIGYLSLWSVYWGFKIITGKEGMGYGDFKLLALIGAFLGPAYILSTLVVATVVGLVVGITLLKKEGESKPFAFGPYLALGGIICAVFSHIDFIKIP